MAKILKGKISLSGKNEIALSLNEKEIEVTLDIFIGEYLRVTGDDLGRYGPMSIEELKTYIDKLRKAKKQLEEQRN